MRAINNPNKACMNISIEKKIFSEAVYKVARFAERKSSTLPALSSILILAGDDGIKMRATNLETGIDLKLEGICMSEGVVAIPATLLQQIAGSLVGEGKITLEHSVDVISLTSGTSKSAIKTVPYDDFPSIPFPENPKKNILLPGVLLRTLFSSIAACASPSTIRPELASLYFAVEGGLLTVVATDSFRLAEKKVPLSNKGIQGTFLIPAKNALEIAQALPDGDVTISFDEHQCAFVSSQGMIVSLSFDPKRKHLVLFAKNSDIGESSESLSAQILGSDLNLSFNHRFLSTVFSLTTSESISLTAAGIGRPIIIKGVGDNSLLYLISPMNQ